MFCYYTVFIYNDSEQKKCAIGSLTPIVSQKDMDIPTAAEGHIFTTPLRKFFWVFFQVRVPFYY
jgi:hypothetical protein